MKNTDLFEAIGEIDDKLIKDAKFKKAKKKNLPYYMYAASVAVFLVISILIGALLPFFIRDEIMTPVVSYPDLPQYTPNPETFQKFALASPENLQLSMDEIFTTNSKCRENGITIDNFVSKTALLFLTGDTTKNYTYSPLNIFLALSMLAETTDGNSRKQILDVLGYDNMVTLREHANLLNTAHNFQTDMGICSVANSLWLSEQYKFNQNTLDKIAEIHRGASYYGNFANPEYVTAFKEWINNSTHGILQNHVENMNVAPSSVMQLVSTIYFSSEWSSGFDKAQNTYSIFKTPDGKIKCEFMNKYKSQDISYYLGDNYSKVTLHTQSNIYLSIYLPDKGVSIEDVLAGGLNNDKYIDAKVNLSLPKFDFSTEYDLTKMLPYLGVTDIFDDQVSNFSPLLESDNSLYISQADHSARISIDEKGCTAGAFAQFGGLMGGVSDPKEVDFIVDRPFIFVLESTSSIPLFIGIVNNPCST